MSFWRLILNNPEWVAALASIVFAIFTIAVMIWQGRVMKAQVRVMKWQGRTSARNEHTQNRLIRLQFEREWLLRLNEERERLLKLARKLHLTASSLTEAPSIADARHWAEVQDIAFDLHARLNILDLATFTGQYDEWYSSLTNYVEAIIRAIGDDYDFNKKYQTQSDSPTSATKKALKDAAENCGIVDAFLSIETAIRMEFFEFKKKWDDLIG